MNNKINAEIIRKRLFLKAQQRHKEQQRKEQEYKIDDCIAQLIVRYKKEKESGIYISEDFVHRVG